MSTGSGNHLKIQAPNSWERSGLANSSGVLPSEEIFERNIISETIWGRQKKTEDGARKISLWGRLGRRDMLCHNKGKKNLHRVLKRGTSDRTINAQSRKKEDGTPKKGDYSPVSLKINVSEHLRNDLL